MRLRKKRLRRRFGFFGGGGSCLAEDGGTLVGGDVWILSLGGAGGVNGTLAGGMVFSDVARGGEEVAEPGGRGVEAVLL